MVVKILQTDTDVTPLLAADPWLAPFKDALFRRSQKIADCIVRMTGNADRLPDIASGHMHFGLHSIDGEWVFREWAPNAEAVFLIGTMTGWRERRSFALHRLDASGQWEIRIPADRMAHLDLFRLRIHWPGGKGDRIPTYAARVVQDPDSGIFNAQVWRPPDPYRWRHATPEAKDVPPLVYEAHVGMAQQEEKVGTYAEFTRKILPKIAKSGYNTIQLMALQEHPYYASFGYQVTNFFAASSRFGTPEDLKALIDTAHGMGIRVIMDLIHSHAASNEVEGISRFDGTPFQFFHAGERGRHPVWDSRCFDYGKPEVLHFLLSNCRYWLDEYRLDGFRFDGITSMLYVHHGIGKAFASYHDYFDGSVDEDALCYLALANKVVHEVRPDAVTIAEDVSGMPFLACPRTAGGIGFDYRFAMGVPDFWTKLTRDIRDEDWHMGTMWRELTNRRREEKSIAYAESHDQALVGDQTLIFRLIGRDIYDHMQAGDNHWRVDRGMALHKMIRLLTLGTAGHGYLNFMGNEFGHPEWIDFPREGNGWSHHYARRQWHLAENANLKYKYLAAFDREMIHMVKLYDGLKATNLHLLHEHNDRKIIVFRRGELVFVFNFHPHASYPDYRFEAPPGTYRMVLDTDHPRYGGWGRLSPGQIHHASLEEAVGHPSSRLSLYLPSRTGQLLHMTVGSEDRFSN